MNSENQNRPTYEPILQQKLDMMDEIIRGGRARPTSSMSPSCAALSSTSGLKPNLLTCG